MMVTVSASEMPAFTAHWEVWGLGLAIACGGLYVARVIGPKVVESGEKVVNRRQVVAFWLALAFMMAVSVWPVHDISEQRLYSAHMFQHLVLTLVVPPLFLLSCPGWLAGLLVRSDGRTWHVVRFLAKPLLAWGIFNFYNLLSHWQVFVNTAVTNGPFHFGAHVLFVLTALLMWVPVCGPWPELRLSLPGQMIYLFVQSIIPTLPAAWLANAGDPVYSSYDQPIRLWGISVMDDQVAAGMIMKVLETIYLWAIIGSMFFRWAARHQEAERQGLDLTERQILEWEEGEHGGLDGSPSGVPRTAAPRS
jgi:putative membrane protein